MPPGKLAAQAGHAFLEAYLASPPDEAAEYRADSPGTKVVLAGGLSRIMRALDQCERRGIPHALIVDSGHICPPDFDGSPVITALGVGLSPDAPRIASRFKLWRSDHDS